jgi:hypothetical protein
MSYPLFTPEVTEMLRDYKIHAPTIAGYLKIPFHALTDFYATGSMVDDPLEDHTITLKLSARALRQSIREGADPVVDCDTTLPEGSIVKALATSNPDEHELGELERKVKRAQIKKVMETAPTKMLPLPAEVEAKVEKVPRVVLDAVSED